MLGVDVVLLNAAVAAVILSYVHECVFYSDVLKLSSFLNAISHVNKTTDVFEVFGSAFNMKMNEKKNTLSTVHYQYMAKCMGRSV